MTPFRTYGSRGMTLPELMVGLAVGLFVSTIAISTFVSTRTLNVVNSSSTRMTENARLATETLHTDLRNAGFAGCLPLNQRRNAEEGGTKMLTSVLDVADDFFVASSEYYSGLRGYSATGAGHSPALPAALADAATGRLLDSDIISMRVPADARAMEVVGWVGAPVSGYPKLKPNTPGNTVTKGDVLLISNCKAAALFQVTAADPAATGNLEHAVGELKPGNKSLDMKNVFDGEATVYRMQTRHYYVARSTLRPGTNSLWRLTVPAPAGGEPIPEEVASGIDRLTVTYGVDSDTTRDFSVNRYLTASAVAAADQWDRVQNARVQIVAATVEDRMAMVKQQYKLDSGTQTATDNRLRTVLTEGVTLRNGTP
jgi:type IV pilus assembly protein PilW